MRMSSVRFRQVAPFNMKISIQHYNTTVTTETSDDGDIVEVIQHIKGLLVACGFHPHTVDQHLDLDDFNWFNEEGEMKGEKFDPKVFDYLENIYKTDEPDNYDN